MGEEYTGWGGGYDKLMLHIDRPFGRTDGRIDKQTIGDIPHACAGAGAGADAGRLVIIFFGFKSRG